jgi:hypothetical protein
MRKDLSDVVRVLDDLFGRMALADEAPSDLSVEQVVDGLWCLLESGDLQLVIDGESIGVEPSDGNRAARRAVAKRNRSLIEARRRLLGATPDNAA